MADSRLGPYEILGQIGAGGMVADARLIAVPVRVGEPMDFGVRVDLLSRDTMPMTVALGWAAGIAR